MFGGQFRAIRSLLATGRTSAPRHAKRSISGISVVSVILSGIFLVPLVVDRTPALAAADCAPASTSPSSGTGTVVYARSGNSCFLAFKNTGAVNTQTSFTWSVPAGVSAGDVLVVGGGGGGGSRHAGGGGAGGYVEVTSYTLTAGGNVSIKVGAGGSGAAGNSTYQGSSGQASDFKVGSNGLTALGGGYGSYSVSAANGGSGGGAGWDKTAGVAVPGSQTQLNGNSIADVSFGNSGATGANESPSVSGSDFWAGGGGGGAGSAGKLPTQNGIETTGLTSASGAIAGAGGDGKSPSWAPVSIQSTLGIGEVSGSAIFFAGGGGGGAGADASAAGPGGLGGGGDGFKFAVPASPNQGAAATGGGGGSSGFDDISRPSIGYTNPPGASGGSGVVLVRYALSAPAQVAGLTVSSQRLVDSDSDTDQVSLSWTQAAAQTPAVTGYEVRYSTNSDMSSASTQAVSGISTTTATVTGLDDGKTYYFQVFATNDEADGSGIEISNSSATVADRAVSKEDYALAYDESFTTLGTSNVIPNSTAASFSVEAWIKPTTIDSYHVIAEQRNSTSSDGGYFWLGLDDDVAGGVIELWKNSSQVISYQPSSLLNRWTHVAVTVTTNQTIKLYVDGTLVATASQTQAAVTGDLFSIGSEANGSYPFNGEIDQVKIWSDVLSTDEVADSMHAWQADTDYNGTDELDNLISHYDFNDNTQASVLRDMYGDNDLTISSGATFESLVNKPTRSGYEVYEFTRSYLTSEGGWNVPTGVSSVESLVVAGGGGGGADEGGGGGAGGLTATSSQSVSGVEPVIVGQGGIGGYATGSSTQLRRASSGQDSIFGTGGNRVSTGGGGAGGDSTSASSTTLPGYSGGDVAKGLNGGSGGGAAGEGHGESEGNATGDGDGNNGAPGTSTFGGGGGGAGAASSGRAGGAGVQSAITGTLSWYAAGGSGGLGNSGSGGQASTNGTGGAGGSSTDQATSGAANTGTGGGGGEFLGTATLGAHGGSGVVVLAYPIGYTLTLDNDGNTTTQSLNYQDSPTDPGLTKTGYTLAGWSDADDLTAEYEADLSDYSMPASGDTLYAVWAAGFLDLDATRSGTATGTWKDLRTDSNPTTIGTFPTYVDAPSDYFSFSGTQALRSASNPYRPDAFTVEVFFRTTQSGPQKIIGFEDTGDGSPSAYDRHFYIDGANKLNFGIWNGSVQAVTSTNAVNDGQWHHAVAAFGGGQFTFYLDGAKVGDSAGSLVTQDYQGYWTVGTKKLDGWLSPGPSAYFVGDIAVARVYDAKLDPSGFSRPSFNHAVTWDANGGTSVSPSSVAADATLAAPTPPTRDGYTFAGWSATDGGAAVSFPYSHGKTSDFTMYALWTVDNYTITFNKGTASGATGADQTASKTNGVNLALPDSETANTYFTRTGYTVTSWSTNGDGSTSDYALGANYTTDAADTLYPVWTANTYTVTYNYNGATGNNSTASSDYNTGGTAITLPTPTKTGYTFGGWYTNSDLNDLSTIGAGGASYTPTTSLTVYAKWTGNINTVTFKSNFVGGASDSTQSITSGQATALTANAFTRGGYTFAGWNTNADGTSGTDYTNQESVTITGALTLYAKWTQQSVPSGPTAVTSIPSGTSMAVSWSAPVELASKTITGYKVEYANADRDSWSTAGVEPWQIASSAIAADATSYTITGLTPGESYYVRVAALYSGGQGAYGYRWTTAPVYETTQAFRDSGGKIVYSTGKGVDSSGNAETSVTDFSRVRYRMEATYGGSANYVDANFDRELGTKVSGSSNFDSIDKLQVPTTSGTGAQFRIQGNISDLNIQSNVTGVIDGAGLNGRLELWPHNYQTTSAFGDGSGDDYDISDTSIGTGGYGSFQLHRLDGVNEPVLSWNRHSESDINNVDIGFGPQSTGNPDWTFAARDEGATGRTNFKLQIFVNEPVEVPSNYTLSFDANGGTGTMSAQTVVAATATTINNSSFTRAGYFFDGWNTQADGGGTSYANAGSITISANTTLYAKWDRATYTFSFDNNYSGDTDSTITYYSGDTVTLPTPTRDGYTFKGWYTATTGGTKLGDAGDTYSPLVSDNLILRYELDDPSSYSGSGTTITDISADIASVTGAVNATATNGPAFSTADGMSFSFDGTNDYILTGDLKSRFGADNRAVSLFAWVYPTGNGVIVSELGQTTINSNWHDSQIEMVSGKLRFSTWGGSYSTTNVIESGTITLNQWYYVGLTHTGTTLSAYIDGQAIGTKSYTRNAPTVTANATAGVHYGLGATDSTNLGDGNYGNFKLGSFHVYKSGISAADVLANYQATCARFDDSCTERTLYAQWQQAGYDITFSAGDNSTGSDVTATKNFDVAYTIPDADTSRGYFTRTGYTLTAWATNSDGTGTSYDFGDSYATNATLTLYPVWTANTYTITFNKGSVTGATGADQTTTKTHDQNLALPNSATANGYFTKTGYTVTGWSTSADGSTSDFALGANYITEEADTLYPVWTADTYTVTYSYDGATSGNSTASSDYTVDGIVVSLPTPLKTGYTFAGWYSEAGLTNLVGLGGASYSPSADITLYAKWSAATFTVIFDYNEATGGNSTASDTFTTGGTAITLPTPTRTGYTFGGWYSNSNLTVLSTVGAGGASYSPTSNLTIYAKWTGVTRNVNYNDTNSTGGSVPTDSADYIIGDSVVVKANSGLLARTGYTFAGWVTNSDGSGTAKNAGETITVSTADIELYPKWTANTYTITYNRNGATGGSLAKATDTYTTGALSGTTLAGGGTMTKTGYSFVGWSTTTTGTIPLWAFTTTADVTVYAIWSPVDYDFDYDLNTGSGTAPTTQSANITETVTISGIGSATKTGHWFGGWNTASDGSGSTYAAGATASIPVNGATLYAIWVPDQYRISYNANGGTGGPDLSATDGFDTATFGVAYTLRAINDLARTGYTFSHWSLNAAGTGDKYDLTQNSLDELTQYTPTANTTFYAQWTAVSYSHTFDVAGGSASLGTYGRTLGQSLSMPSAGSRTGYVFDSWTDGTNDYAVGSTYTVTAANKSFTAQWIPNIYTVTYDWQGGTSSSPDTSDNYTVGTGPMDLPTATGSGYSRDGYTFSGWSTTAGGTLVSDFEPTADDVLYAVWADGNYTLTYVPKGGTVGSGLGTVGRGSAVTLPTPVRANFTFTGWYDSASGGVKIGDGGASFTPGNSRNLYARWVQNSLFGVDEATLESGSTYTASDSTGTDATLTHTPSGTSARVQIPAGALDAGTVVNVRYFKETDRQSDLIDSDNSYFFALLVSWLKGSGDTATVPTTATDKPITVTLNNDSIVAGAMVYQVIGDTVTELGRATEDGTVTVELTEDPEIVVAATAPSAPTSVAGVAGDTAATVSWTAGSSGGAEITSYTVTASPGGATCTTATTSCVVSGLTNNTSYTFSVTATNSIGTSAASSSSGAVTPVGASYVVTFNSNGGSSVSAGSFFSGGSVTAPVDPTRSGFTFAGWSTTLDDDATEVSFPYSPGVLTAITLYALWTEDPAEPDSGSSGGSAPTPPDTVTPTPPATPVTEPVGSVEGSSQVVTVAPDAPNEKLVASGAGWELSVAAKTATGATAPVREELSLEFQLATKAAVSGSGLRPNSKVQVWVFSDATYVGEAETLADGSFETSLALPASILPGNHTMQVISFDSVGRKITVNIPITVVGKVTVGTFKGYIAIYTKDLVGQKLSAMVAGKWLVQNPIANYKSYGYSRVVRKTGAGYKIYVHLYLNGAFLRTDVITTR